MRRQRLYVHCQKDYGSFRLDIALDICPSFTAIFGISGAGKTTLLNLISGLIPVDTGLIEWDGCILTDSNRNLHIPPHKRGIGYVFQDTRLFPHKSVYKNLIYGWRLTPGKKRRFSIDEVVDILGLNPLLDRMPETLSGGEKQRVALGMALLASPDLLLMDEPLVALDKHTKLKFLSYLKEVHSIFNLPILYISHDLTSVINFANDAIVMHNGKVKTVGETWRALLEGGVEALVSGEVENIFHARVKARYPEQRMAELDIGGALLSVPDRGLKVGDNVLVEVPASEIIIALSRPIGISARNVLSGDIETIHSLHERCLVDINIGKRITAEILPDTKTSLGLEERMAIYVIIKARCVHMIND